MLNLFCYSDKIIYQTSNEKDFKNYEMQSILEGLKTVKGEFFPFKIDNEKILFGEDNKPLPLDNSDLVKKGLKTLEEYKDIVFQKINNWFENSFSSISKKYTLAEREGWGLLVNESENWLLKGDINYIPALHAETDFTKDTEIITNRAKEVISKSSEYRNFYGRMKRDKMERVKRLVAATNPDEVFEIEEELKNI